MSIIVNWKRSNKLQGGAALAPTDTGTITGVPVLEDGELAINSNASDPCLWLRKADNTLAKFRPTAGLTMVDTEADLPVIGPSLHDGDAFVVRKGGDGLSREDRLVVFDAKAAGGAGGWNWDVTPKTWLRDLARTPEVASTGVGRVNLQRGDFSVLLQANHESLSVYTGSQWQEIFGWDTLELRKPTLKWAGRFSDLPVPKLGKPIADGQSYMVEFDLGGQPLDRMVVWRETQKEVPAGGTNPTRELGKLRADSEPPSTAYSRLADLGDPANPDPTVQAQFAGWVWGYWIWEGADYAVQPADFGGAGRFLNGTVLHAGDKVGVANTAAAGQAPTYGWRLGASFDTEVLRFFGAAPAVGTVQKGVWHVVEPTHWVHGLAATTDNTTDAKDGDLTFVTEKDKEVIKVFSGGAWIEIPTTSTEFVRKMIASLSLFEGTTHEDSTTIAGAVPLSALPDLTSSDPLVQAANFQKVGHYWIYVGPDYTVPAVPPASAPTGGTGTTGRTLPGAASVPVALRQDLNGAVLRSGEWILIANRGGDGAPGNPAPDLHYVHVPSDLLTYSRAIDLFGHRNWQPGNWEQGSLVVFNGSLWRAANAVLAADAAPTETGSIAQVIDVTVDAAISAASTAGEVFALTIDGTAARYTTLVAAESQDAIRNGLLAAVQAIPQITNTIKVEATAIAGQLRLSARQPGVPFVVTVSANLNEAVATANVTASPWVKVPINGGLRFVPAETDLPVSAKREELFYVLSHSGNNGQGALTYYDSGAGRWQLLGGGAGVPLNLTGGDLIYPDVLLWDGAATSTKPAGRVVNDLLLNSSQRTLESWDGNRWVLRLDDQVLANLTVNAANSGHFPYFDSTGLLAVSTKDFNGSVKDVLESEVPKVFPQISTPASDAADSSGSVASFNWRSAATGVRNIWTFYAKTEIEPLLYVNTASADGTRKHIYAQGQMAVGSIGLFRFNRDENATKATYYYKSIGYGNSDNNVHPDSVFSIETFWYKLAAKDVQVMEYTMRFFRKAGNDQCVIWGRFWGENANADPITGYAINCDAYHTLAEVHIY